MEPIRDRSDMVDVPFITAVVSIGFLTFVAATLAYFAFFLGPAEGDGDDTGNSASLAD
jgi:hypothetical protein